MRLTRLIPIVAILAACGGGGNGGGSQGPPTGPPSPPPPGTVILQAASFNPTSIQTTVGGTITWSNTSGIVHNVTFEPGTGAPSNIPDHSSGSNQRTFNTAGNFAYSCTIHPGMDGQVVVQ